MKKLFIALSLISLLTLLGGVPPQAAENSGAMVLICASDSAYAYHNSRGCRGLGRCRSKVLQVSIPRAKELGKGKPCGYCYRKR